jgi:Carboxypeptidase regulatory-like domain/TonB-dependent Receptor Plug Domain/TonB dependent receptor
MKPPNLPSDLRTFTQYILTVALLLFSSSLAAMAQDLDTVTITGRVMDQNGAVIPGASITAVLTTTGVERTVSANNEGRYKLIQLEPGTYTLRVSSSGFATEEKKDLTVVAGQNVQLDVTLKPQSVVAEPVIVTAADAAPVDTTRTVVGGTITTHEVESLPINTRSPLDLIFTLPGVTEEPLSTRDLAEDRSVTEANTPEEAGSFSLAGGAAYSNNITIDGLDNNDDRSARERFQPSVEAVEEVQIITNQFSAEYGRASGGRINIRMRGGAKNFHGRGFFFFRDEALNANTFRNNMNGVKRLPLQEQDPGFTLGGPLSIPKIYRGRNRTFFFTSYEFDKLLDSALINTLVPVQQNPLFGLPAPTNPEAKRDESVASPAVAATGGIAPFISSVNTPQRNHIFTTRVDHKFTEAHNSTIVFQLGRLTNLREFGGGDRLADALLGKTRNSDAISYSDNYVFSAKLVNQARAQFSRLTPAVEAQGGLKPVVLISIKDTLPPPGSTGTETLVAGTSTSGATDRREQRFQVQDIVSYIAGAHSLRFGGDVQRIKSTFIDLTDASGTFNFASAGDFLANTPSRYRQTFLTTSTQRNTYLGFFAQDEWRLRSNLTFSYGLRWEDESIVRDLNNFGPRVAAAYDPFKNGKTAIRLGAGIFYNRALLRTIDDFTLGGQSLTFDTNAISATTDGRRAFIAANLHFPQTLTADSPLVQQYGVLNKNFSRRRDPNLRIPESYQTNVGFERDLGKNFFFEANYTWNRGIHLWREFNANAPVLPKGFKNFTEYLGSRDFANFRSSQSGVRPIYNVSTAGDLVRFTFGPFNPSDPAKCSGFSATSPDVVGCIRESGVNVTLINLNSFTSGAGVDVALAALRNLRPDPTQAEIEQLAPLGNSFYHGLTFQLRHRFRSKATGFGYTFRAAYALSFLRDDGIVNTSDALVPGDFQHELARSLLDRRHRFVFSGTFDAPRYLGQLRLAPILRITSGAPFNISAGGIDRNLDDVNNDRPIFTGDLRLLQWRRPGDPIDPTIISLFSLPAIGQSGNLPRNAGTGPGQFIFDLNVMRDFRLSERVKLRPVIEFDNVLNKTVFSYGSEFINFDSLSPTATAAQRQALIDSFLVTTRTLRPRQIRVGIRLDF